MEPSPLLMPSLTGLCHALQRPRQQQTDDSDGGGAVHLGSHQALFMLQLIHPFIAEAAAAVSAMDVSELKDDEWDDAEQRTPTPDKRARGSWGASASRGARCLFVGWGRHHGRPSKSTHTGRQAAMASNSVLPTWAMACNHD